MAVTITQEITLDTVKYNTFKLIAKQYDTSSRFLKVTVQQDGETLDVSDALTATINIRRPDDNTLICKGTVNSDGTVTVPLPNYALLLDGDVKCSVGVLGEETELKTLNFTIEVQEAESEEDEDLSENENYNTILELITTVAELETSVETAEASRVSAETARVTEYNSLITGLNSALAQIKDELASVEEAIAALQNEYGIVYYWNEDGELCYLYPDE